MEPSVLGHKQEHPRERRARADSSDPHHTVVKRKEGERREEPGSDRQHCFLPAYGFSGANDAPNRAQNGAYAQGCEDRQPQLVQQAGRTQGHHAHIHAPPHVALENCFKPRCQLPVRARALTPKLCVR